MATTKFEELPLHYKHEKQEGTLILSFAVNDKEEIMKGYYFWAIQLDSAEVKAHGEVKGLKKLNEIRNKFIGDGWRRALMPKVKQAEGTTRKQKRAQAKLKAKSQVALNMTAKRAAQKAKQAEERRLAFEKIKKQVKDSEGYV
jgi:hypothetical protein